MCKYCNGCDVYIDFGFILCRCGAPHHVTRHNTPIHNILSTATQLSISQKAQGRSLKMAM
jgi:hypothetical protein